MHRLSHSRSLASTHLLAGSQPLVDLRRRRPAGLAGPGNSIRDARLGNTRAGTAPMPRPSAPWAPFSSFPRASIPALYNYLLPQTGRSHCLPPPAGNARVPDPEAEPPTQHPRIPTDPGQTNTVPGPSCCPCRCSGVPPSPFPLSRGVIRTWVGFDQLTSTTFLLPALPVCVRGKSSVQSTPNK